MKRGRFTEEQIIALLREQEAGVATAEVCRKHGVSSATFYKWKAKFGGLQASEAKRLRALEDENGRLKRMLADTMLDNAALKDLLGNTLFCQELTMRRSTVSSSRFPSLAFCPDPRSGGDRISTFVRGAWFAQYGPDHSRDLDCECDGHFVHMHPSLQGIEPC